MIRCCSPSTGASLTDGCHGSLALTIAAQIPNKAAGKLGPCNCPLLLLTLLHAAFFARTFIDLLPHIGHKDDVLGVVI